MGVGEVGGAAAKGRGEVVGDWGRHGAGSSRGDDGLATAGAETIMRRCGGGGDVGREGIEVEGQVVQRGVWLGGGKAVGGWVVDVVDVHRIDTVMLSMRLGGRGGFLAHVDFERFEQFGGEVNGTARAA